jgi:type IV pilus assembly protein PilY1
VIKNIILPFILIAFFSNSTLAKSPPPGTGSLVPSNIMIMLDNSGSMSWNLSGSEITTNSFLKGPTDIETDSAGNVYVYQQSNSNFEGKNYRMHVFDSDGNFLRRMLESDGNYKNSWDPTCGQQYDSRSKIAMYNDQIYYLDGNYYRSKISVISTTGQCVRQSSSIDSAGYGSYRSKYNSIAVTENYIYLGQGNCSFYCFTSGSSRGGGGSITILNRSDFSFVKKIGGFGNYYQSNLWGDISDITINASGTKMLVSSNQAQSVCLHALSGTNIGGCTKVGSRPTGRSNHNYDRSWWKVGDYGGTYPSYHYNPSGLGFDSSDNIYVVRAYKANSQIAKFNSSGTYVSSFGTRSWSGDAWANPEGLHITSSNKIYVADTYNHKVRAISFNASNVGSVASTIATSPLSRMDIAHKVIKRIVSNTELTSSANFGLMEWGHPSRSIRWSNAPKNSAWRYNYYGTRIRVPVSEDGARLIYSDIDNVKGGGGTYLSPALTIARSYFANGHSGFPSPRIANATCQTNYLIVISDGVWANHSNVKNQVRDLKNQYQIKTFSVGFAVSSLSASTKQNYVDVAVNGGTVSPLYADNEKEMIAKLTDAIKQVTSGSLTFNTPAVMSEKQKGDFIYQSTFKYSRNTQWEGHLKKNKYDSKTGKFVACDLATCWDAAEKLNKKSASSRNIWTTGTGYTDLNNFKTDNRGILKNFLFPDKSATDAETDKLINFIRGQDSYDENGNGNITETRHKLADIYHANLNVVGPVEDNAEENDGTSNYDKKDSHYRFRNGYINFKNGNSCGGTCSSRDDVVLAGSNGGILHAFRASDGEELWGFIPPNIIHKLSTMVTSKANASNPIYGIDGTATIKDIYYDDTPDDGLTNPRWRTILLSGLGAGGHGYFALDITDINSPKHLFAIENDPFDKIINIWGSNQIKKQYNYSGGVITEDYDYQKLGEAWSAPNIIRIKDNGKDKWVAVIGGGFNSATNPNYGSAVFVIDLEAEGQILKKIDIEDSSSSNIVNSIPGDLAVITANGTGKANYNGALVYAADLEGKITKINLTDQGTMYETTTLFDAQSTNENGRYVFKKPEATIKDSKFWLYFGTGDMQKLQKQTSSISNRLYGIKDKDFPNYKTISPTGTVAQCTTGSNNCPSTADLGWYIDLDKSKKVTAKPTVDKNVVYFPVYEPKTAGNVCDTGDAILFTASSTCGRATQRPLGKGVASEVVVQKGNLIIGISGEAEKSLTSKENLITLSAEKSSSQKVTLDGWKEN